MILGIVAISKNGVIAVNGKMPWHIPSDLRWFKEMTSGESVVMGRKTFESLGSKPLPNRVNIVLSKTMEERDDVVVLRSRGEVLRYIGDNQGDTFIIGGAEIFATFMFDIQMFLVTEIDAVIPYSDDDDVTTFSIHKEFFKHAKTTTPDEKFLSDKDEYRYVISTYEAKKTHYLLADDLGDDYSYKW